MEPVLPPLAANKISKEAARLPLRGFESNFMKGDGHPPCLLETCKEYLVLSLPRECKLGFGMWL